MILCEYRPILYSVLMGVRGQPQLSIPPFVLPHSRDEGRDAHMVQFYVHAGDLNSGPHTYMASTLPTEPFLWL